MDVASVRYLVSALVQAIAVAWALILTIYVAYRGLLKELLKRLDDQEFRKRMKEDLSSINIYEGIERSPQGQKFVEALSEIFRKTTKNLRMVNVLSLATIVLGIFSLVSIDDSFTFGLGVPSVLVILVIGLSILTFGVIAHTVHRFLIGQII